VVVADGETEVEPELATRPTPLLIDTDVAPVVDQLSVDDCPGATDAGSAVRLAVGGAGLTVTVAELVVVPPAPVAVSVYVVVPVGETEVEPEAATAPTPLLIEVDVAFVVDQFRVVD
jgi:hypothetical protein